MTPSTLLHFMYLWIKLYVVAPLTQKWQTRRVPELPKVGQDVPGAVALVTGSTSGLGKITAVDLGRRGAKVVLACRDTERGLLVAKEVEAAQVAAGFPAQTQVVALDQSSVESAEECANEFLATNTALHILINNGGIYDMGGGRKSTPSGFEQHMMVNHLSHFSLTLRLLPLLRKSAAGSSIGARIVNLSSDLHELAQIRPRDMFLIDNYSSQLAYANSKCAQVMFTRQLRALEKTPGVHVFAAHPGDVLTTIARSLPGYILKAMDLIGPLFLLTPSQGARTTLHCATSANAPHEAHKSGGYFSADCKPDEPSTLACNAKLAQHMWKFSSHAVKLPEALDPLQQE